MEFRPQRAAHLAVLAWVSVDVVKSVLWLTGYSNGAHAMIALTHDLAFWSFIHSVSFLPSASIVNI